MTRLLRHAIPAMAIAAILLGIATIGPARAATHAVEISGFAFSPADLTVTVGDTVTWTNLDAIEHTATGTGFDSGLLAQGETYSVTFTAPGTYAYLCTPHPTMTGTIVVTGAPATPAPGGSIPDVALPAGRNADLVALGGALILLGAVTLAPRLRSRRR